MSTDQLKELEEALVKLERKWIEADAIYEFYWDLINIKEDPREAVLEEASRRKCFAYREMQDVRDQIHRLRYPKKEDSK